MSDELKVMSRKTCVGCRHSITHHSSLITLSILAAMCAAIYNHPVITCPAPRRRLSVTTENVMMKDAILDELGKQPFVPHAALKNGHAQTLAGALIPRRFRRVIENREERLFDVA